MSPAVHTVLGDVDPGRFTAVLPHEHLVCDFSGVTGSNNHILNDVALAIDELAILDDPRSTLLVEVTTPDFGRDPAALQQISTASGVSVVMGTGWYRSPYYPTHITSSTVGELAAAMVHELTTGVVVPDRSAPIRAGVIGEIGADRGFVDPAEERVLRAAARASNQTGAPVITHAAMHPVGLAQLGLLTEENVPAERVIIGHADTYLDVNYHTALLRRGAYLAFDTCGRNHLNPDDRRADALVELIRQGWIDQLLISSDRCFRSDLRAFGGVGYAWTLTGFRQMLHERGLNAAELDHLTRLNPLRVLAW